MDQSFDLSPARIAGASADLAATLFFIAVGVVLSVIFLTNLPPGGGTLYYGLGSAVVFADVALTWLGLVTSRGNPVGLHVDEVGVHLTWPWGRPFVFRWEDPRLSMLFRDGSYLEQTDRRDSVRVWNASVAIGWRPGGPAVRLTPGTMTAVLEEAERRGLSIDPSNWREPSSSLRTIRVRARPSPVA